nr:unnamed protein product [Callosobruchus analis]
MLALHFGLLRVLYSCFFYCYFVWPYA